VSCQALAASCRTLAAWCLALALSCHTLAVSRLALDDIDQRVATGGRSRRAWGNRTRKNKH
jgi:hypothetical protein